MKGLYLASLGSIGFAVTARMTGWPPEVRNAIEVACISAFVAGMGIMTYKTGKGVYHLGEAGYFYAIDNLASKPKRKRIAGASKIRNRQRVHQAARRG